MPARDVVAAAARRLRPFVPPPFSICRKQTPECGLHSGRDDRRAVAILGLLATIGLPALFRTAARLRLEMAGREVASVLRLAQAYAVRHSANVAVRFETAEDGRVRFRLHRDGNGDGVLNRDIDAGIDPAITPSRVVRYLGADVGFSFPQREPPLHPSTGRPLQNLGDPIRFNRSDLASFAPLGTATPGTLYLSDRRSQLVAVRVVSRTGRVRIQRYDYETRRWTEI